MPAVQAQLRSILGVLQTPLDDRFIERLKVALERVAQRPAQSRTRNRKLRMDASFPRI